MTFLHRRPYGFSLLETAGTLGLVGLIIGGIWIAAESSRDSSRTAQALSQTSIITQNIRNLYKGSRIVNTNSFTVTNLVNAGVFPQDMLVGGVPQTPWGTPIAIQANGTRAFNLTYTNLPKKGCMALFAYYVGERRDPQLTALSNNRGQSLATGLSGGNSENCTTLNFTFGL